MRTTRANLYPPPRFAVGRTWTSVGRRSQPSPSPNPPQVRRALPPYGQCIATLPVSWRPRVRIQPLVACSATPSAATRSYERGKPFLPVPRAPTPPALPRQPQLGVGHHRLRAPRLHSPRPLSSVFLLRRVLQPSPFRRSFCASSFLLRTLSEPSAPSFPRVSSSSPHSTPLPLCLGPTLIGLHPSTPVPTSSRVRGRGAAREGVESVRVEKKRGGMVRGDCSSGSQPD